MCSGVDLGQVKIKSWARLLKYNKQKKIGIENIREQEALAAADQTDNHEYSTLEVSFMVTRVPHTILGYENERTSCAYHTSIRRIFLCWLRKYAIQWDWKKFQFPKYQFKFTKGLAQKYKGKCVHLFFLHFMPRNY